MGFFDRFRKPKPEATSDAMPGEASLPQLCYDIAYFILPHYAYRDLSKLTEMCLNQPTIAGPYYYVMACAARKIEPDVRALRVFRWHHGSLDDGREFFVLEYPVPPPLDLTGVPIEAIVGGSLFVLAPHYSAIVRDSATGDSSYYVLGQAPIGGGTTLRYVERDGANCNLGPGPEPHLEAFLAAIGKRAE